MSINARQEFLKTVGERKVKCALIKLGNNYSDEESLKILLKVNHNEEDYNTFLQNLDVDYDNGYGVQELFGTIWLEDGTWCERSEYDGSEKWEHRMLPEIPEILK